MGAAELELKIKELEEKLRSKDEEFGKITYTNKQLIHALKLINGFTKSIRNRHYSINDICNNAVEEIIAANMESASTVLYLVSGDKLVVKAAVGISADEKRNALDRSEKYARYWRVVDTGKDDIDEGNNRILHPIKNCDEDVIGLMEINRAKNGVCLESGNYAGLDNITQLLGLFLDRDELSLDSFKSLAKTIEAKDPYTRGHSDRVTGYAIIITQEHYKTSQKALEFESALEATCPLHDIGKLFIDDSILKKAGPLTGEEREVIKEHPERGFIIVEPILKKTIYSELGTPVIRSHQERYDGNGYPKGLAGDSIPLIARIVAVADAFDAMTSDRPYRKGMSADTAIGIIKGEKGKQFDPVIVNIFTGIYNDKEGYERIMGVMQNK